MRRTSKSAVAAIWCPNLAMLAIADSETLKRWRAKARRMLKAKPKLKQRKG